MGAKTKLVACPACGTAGQVAKFAGKSRVKTCWRCNSPFTVRGSKKKLTRKMLRTWTDPGQYTSRAPVITKSAARLPAPPVLPPTVPQHDPMWREAAFQLQMDQLQGRR